MEVTLDFEQVDQLRSYINKGKSNLFIAKKLGISYEKTLFAVQGITGADPKRTMQSKNKGRGSRSLHGDPGKYNAGCRCGICVKANRKRMSKLAKDRNKRLHEAPHGTASAYVNWGCRCAPCKKAGSENNRKITYTPPETQTRKGERWIGPEDTYVSSYDATARELALALGRTIPAVHVRRPRMAREMADLN